MRFVNKKEVVTFVVMQILSAIMVGSVAVVTYQWKIQVRLEAVERQFRETKVINDDFTARIKRAEEGIVGLTGDRALDRQRVDYLEKSFDRIIEELRYINRNMGKMGEATR